MSAPWRYQREVERSLDGFFPSDRYRIYTESGPFACLAVCVKEADAALIVRAVNAHEMLLDALRQMPCIICETAVGSPPKDIGVPGLSECPGCKLARAALEKAGVKP